MQSKKHLVEVDKEKQKKKEFWDKNRNLGVQNRSFKPVIYIGKGTGPSNHSCSKCGKFHGN